jgi:hypothetical protein
MLLRFDGLLDDLRAATQILAAFAHHTLDG